VEGPPVPIVQEAGRAPEPVWIQRLQEKKISPNVELLIIKTFGTYDNDWAVEDQCLFFTKENVMMQLDCCAVKLDVLVHPSLDKKLLLPQPCTACP
jgi:hypothetical protein